MKIYGRAGSYTLRENNNLLWRYVIVHEDGRIVFKFKTLDFANRVLTNLAKGKLNAAT